MVVLDRSVTMGGRGKSRDDKGSPRVPLLAVVPYT